MCPHITTPEDRTSDPALAETAIGFEDPKAGLCRRSGAGRLAHQGKVPRDADHIFGDKRVAGHKEQLSDELNRLVSEYRQMEQGALVQFVEDCLGVTQEEINTLDARIVLLSSSDMQVRGSKPQVSQT